MRARTVLAVLVAAGTGCATAGRTVPSIPPLRGEGELFVFALPFPREADPLSFTVDAVLARRDDGAEAPLEVVTRAIDGSEAKAQRLLAWGRVPPGGYVGLSLKASGATFTRDGARARLLVAPDAIPVDVRVRVDAGRSVVLWVSVKPAEPVRNGYEFAPALSAVVAPQTPPQVAVFCSNAAGASVTVADRHTRLVTGVVPVGEAPLGIALERVTSRAYVALAREDQIDVLDTGAGESIGRIRLSPGDGPTELGLAADGTLVVLNERSRTIAFVDPAGSTELARVRVGDAPSSLLVDRSGKRAYVTNRGSGTVTAIDLGNRAVFATVPTDPEPLRAQLSRDGTRLYVVHRGSAYLAVYSLPTLTPETRAYVGLGVTTVKIDPRSDLLYLSRGFERRITVYDPVSLQPVDQFDVPGAVSYMTIDDVENTLFAVMPDRATIGAIELTSRKVVAEIPTGPDPYLVTLVGERF